MSESLGAKFSQENTSLPYNAENITGRNSTEYDSTNRGSTERNSAEHNGVKKYSTKHSSTERNSMKHDSMECSSVRHNGVRHSSTDCSSMKNNSAKNNGMKHNGTEYSSHKHHQGTFNEHVYQIVVRIPRGQVATYGQVAVLAGYPRRARFVGYALHSNPEPGVIPCHRVVFRDGSLAPGFAFGGEEHQRELLEQEGVIFVPPADGKPNAGADGWRVDLQRCQWQA